MPSLVTILIRALDVAFQILWWLVLIYVILSWLPVPRWHPAVRLVNRLVEPMLRPFRAVLRVGAGGIDFSPLILLLVVSVVRMLLVALLRGLPHG